MKRIIGIILVIFGLSAGIASATEVIRFGPNRYVRTRGKPHLYTDVFSAVPKAGRIIIKNGDKRGRHRVSSAVIRVNGKKIFNPCDFKKHTDLLQRPVQLLKDNTISVDLNGRHQGCLTIKVVQQAEAPEVSLSVNPDTFFAGESAVLTWTSTNAECCVIKPDIGNVGLNGSVSVSPDETTRYTLTATGPGGRASASAGVTVRTAPDPLNIVITRPIDSETTASADITVEGTVNNSRAAVFVNGVAAKVDGNIFSAGQVPLTPGANIIHALAEINGDSAVSGINVFRMADIDLSPVRAEITSYSQDDASLKVSGKMAVSVFNNGREDITVPYRVTVFEDTDFSGHFEESVDNHLGQVLVPSGPGAGKGLDISIEFSGKLLFRDNLLGVEVDDMDALEEADENNNTMFTPTDGTDLSTSILRPGDTDCPEKITVTARIGNAGKDSVGAGVPVAFYDGEPGNGGVLIAAALSTQKLDPGRYEDLSVWWIAPKAGVRKLYVRVDDDGSGSGVLDETDIQNNLAYSEAAVCTSPPAPTQGGISGQVIDAVTGAPVTQALVSLFNTEDEDPDTVIDQISTDEHGGYIFTGLAPGRYALTVSSQGYLEGDGMAVLSSDENRTFQDIVLSPALEPEEIRIVLTWGNNPKDLEAHLTGPNPDGCRHHCFYWNKEIPGARLDRDDDDGYGPETITIDHGRPGTYRFYVHDFSNRQDPAGQALANSAARVKVYFGSDQAPLTFYPPKQPGTVWHVFNLDAASGTLVPVERMAFQSDPGRIDFPVITSLPLHQANWESLYTYQVEARDPDLDSLTYTLLEGPQGMSLDPFDGTVRWTPAADQGGTHSVKVRVNDGRCGEDMQSFEVKLSYLPMVQFEVEPCSGFNPGGQIILSWDVKRAATVFIDQGIGEVASSGSLAIDSPPEPVSYTLTASNGAGPLARRVPIVPVVSRWSLFECLSPAGSTLDWEGRCAVTCEIDQGIGGVPVEGTLKVTPEKSTIYSLTCSNGSGSKKIEKNIDTCSTDYLPFIEIDAEYDCKWSPGDPVKLSWQGTRVFPCAIDQGIGSVPLSGSLVVRPAEPTTYTITGYTQGGKISRFVDVPRLPRVEFLADPAHLNPGQETTLYWQTDCADSCTIDRAIGRVDCDGSLKVIPSEVPATYTLTAANARGSVQKSVSIQKALPSAAFTVSPGLLKAGQSATLAWSTAQATSCSIKPDIGPVPLSGTISVNPNKNTTYTLVAEGPGGSVEETATVTYVKPVVEIQASPETIHTGESAVLSWVFSNADTCSIDHDIGEVVPGGSISVSPEQTTTYTITASGPGGTARDSVTVSYPEPVVTLSSSLHTISPGETIILSWNTQHAASCMIEPDIGNVAPTGAVEVSPVQTTTYAITAIGPGGSAADSVTVACPEPSVSFSASSQAISSGEAVTLSWSTEHALSCEILPYIGSVLLSGSVSVAPAQPTTYRISAEGCGNSATAALKIDVDCPPSIALIEPDGVGDTAANTFSIRWSDADCDDNAVISIYYDTDNQGADGNLIDGGLFEDPDWVGDQYDWDTRDVADGSYFVYAVIADGKNDPITVYSSGKVTIDHNPAPLAEIKIKPEGAAGSDHFGRSVAVSGDYAVVGSPGIDGGPAGAGAAYTFRREGTDWIQQAKLTCRDPADHDNFGSAVAISGDYIVVGADGKDGQAVYAGAAYVFKREESGWIEQAKITPSDPAAYDGFGGSVAISEDYVIVGADGNDGQALNSGAAYIFKHEGTDWVEQIKLTAGDAANMKNLKFGHCVDIDGDYALVGVSEDFYSGDKGAAYVYMREGAQWREQVKLIGSDTSRYDSFGYAVSLDGDSAIVGAWSSDDKGWASGSAYVFKREGAVWTEQAKLTAGDASGGDNFGISVAIDGNYAAVGVIGDDDAGIDSGSVYLFKREAATWTQQAKLSAGDAAGGEGFGTVVAMAGGQIMVGTEYDDNGTASGAAYLYTGCDAEIRAEPGIISAGTSATLSWHTTHADTCAIQPDIGHVAASGSLLVSPEDTTTYTLAAAGNYGAVSRQVTVRIGDPLPVLHAKADPEVIYIGEATKLTWSSAHADAVVIGPDIGAVQPNGSMTVSPFKTTTYTISATGPGGNTTSKVTVTVIYAQPTVRLSADPETLSSGQSSTLSWSCTDADSVVIDHGIGSVEPYGSLKVFPTQTTTYKITAISPGGTSEASTTVTVINSPISIQITSPLEGDVIHRPDVMVQGTITNSTGNETGVRVNGVAASVSGNNFVVNSIPLVEGVQTITVYATDTDGHIAQAAVTVTAAAAENFIRISANPISGIAPFETTLSIDSTFSIEESSISSSNPGLVEILNSDLDEYEIRLLDEGLYYFTVKATDPSGSDYQDTISIIVSDVTEIDSLLRSKWGRMKSALADQQIENAVSYFTTTMQILYNDIFTALYDKLPQMVQDMENIELVYVYDNLAKYRILKTEVCRGQPISVTHYIYFAIDEDGLWKINGF